MSLTKDRPLEPMLRTEESHICDNPNNFFKYIYIVENFNFRNKNLKGHFLFKVHGNIIYKISLAIWYYNFRVTIFFFKIKIKSYLDSII